MHYKNRTKIDAAKPLPTGSGTDHGYEIEVRLNYPSPKEICGVLMDNRWRVLPVYDAPFGRGVPKPRYKSVGVHAARLLNRTEAEALRWQFLAAAEAEGGVAGSLCVETRIIKYRVTYNYEATKIEILDALDASGGTPEEMPPAEAE